MRETLACSTPERPERISSLFLSAASLGCHGAGARARGARAAGGAEPGHAVEEDQQTEQGGKAADLLGGEGRPQ
jgi:hypothetical protein